ncbi:helix-turn-helix domain-containing protein [Psychromonas arctica]|uniref:helix-turn-helix domain-containing protein n=1 Tax=Psychromonas arctica TaxID=168275 RepID=UPI002FD2C020
MAFLKQHQVNTAPALERCKSFTFDVNQQAESLRQWEQRYNQHSNGTFSGYLDELTLGGVHFFEEFTNRTLQQQCCVKHDNLWLGFSLQTQRPKINNNIVAAGQIMTRPSGIEFELITPPDFHIYGLVINKHSLDSEMIGADYDLWQNTSSHLQMSKPSSYVSYELAKLISLLLGNSNSPIGSTQLLKDAAPERLASLTPLITSKVADLLMQTEYQQHDISISQQTTRRVITEITKHIEDTGEYPLTITELCKIANISRRALQYCFEQGFGVSPIQYIRGCRLNEIRRILLKEGNQNSIADLALNFGFFHISTFNAHYKELFGETPTQTIQRADHYHHPLISQPSLSISK